MVEGTTDYFVFYIGLFSVLEGYGDVDSINDSLDINSASWHVFVIRRAAIP